MFKKDPKKKEQKRLNKALYKAAESGKAAEILELLAQGADIEAQAGFLENNMTPLCIAATAGNTEAVRCLLEQGAQVNARDSAGDTPVRNAVMHGNTRAIEVLMQYDADPNMTNANGKSALSRATYDKRHDLVDIMMRKTGPAAIPPARTVSDAAGPAAAAKETAPPPAPAAMNAEITAGSNPDEVLVRRQIGNRMLEEIFNFAEKERVTLVRAGADGPVEAVTREDFSALQEKPSLRRAFEEYARRGGAVPESDIFPEALAKIKPLQRGP